MRDRTYLFIANITEDRDRAEKVVWEFRRKAWLTNSVLYFAADSNNRDEDNYYRIFPCIDPSRMCKIQVVPKNLETVLSLIRQVDCYIVGNVSNEAIYLQYAIQNNIKIKIINPHSDVDIFEDIPLNQRVIQIRQNMQSVFNTQIVNAFPPNEWEYFLVHNGLGETMTFFYWLKEYRKISNKKIVTFCFRDSNRDLMKICPYVDCAVKVDLMFFDYVAVYFSQKYEIKNLYTLHVNPDVLEVAKKYPDDCKTGYWVMARDFLGIDHTIEKFEHYLVNLPPDSINKAKQIFNDMNLTVGKTIFLIPEGLSANLPYLLDFWKRASEAFLQAGYNVVVNSDKELVKGIPHVFLKCTESVTFAQLCGNIAGIPTGFLEIICALNHTVPVLVQIIGYMEYAECRWFENDNIKPFIYLRNSRETVSDEDDVIINKMIAQLNNREQLLK